MTNLSRAAVLCLLSASIHAQSVLKVEPDAENVVASRLLGRWQLDGDLTRRLGGQQDVLELEFRQDDAVVARIPEQLAARLKEFRINLAGVMKLKGKEYPFLLTQMRGNPHVVWFRERDGHPLGDAESCNVMLPRGDKPEADLLFVGGDHNNQPFAAFARSKPAAKDAGEAVRLALADIERLLIAKRYAELIRTYAEPEHFKKLEEERAIDEVVQQFGETKGPHLQKVIGKLKGKDPEFNGARTEATFQAEGEDRPLKMRLVDGRWYLVN